MKINQLYAQIGAMVNEFYTDVWRMINDFVFAAMTWGKMFHCSYIWRMVNEFNAQIWAVVNNLNPAVQWKCLSVRLTCDGAAVFVDDDLSKVNLLRTRIDTRQHCGKKQGKKQFFHSIQSVEKFFV